jgi:hypothetical protein
VALGESAEKEAIKLVGRWFEISMLPLGNQVQTDIGPWLAAQDSQGKQQNGVLVASPVKMRGTFSLLHAS